jgi:hypothetical protein
MMFKMNGLKRALGVGALVLATTTLVLAAPKAQAGVNVGVNLGVPPVAVAPAPVVAAPTAVAPYAYAPAVPYAYAPGVVGGVNLGFGFGHDGWHGDRGWHERGHGRR